MDGVSGVGFEELADARRLGEGIDEPVAGTPNFPLGGMRKIGRVIGGRSRVKEKSEVGAGFYLQRNATNIGHPPNIVEQGVIVLGADALATWHQTPAIAVWNYGAGPGSRSPDADKHRFHDPVVRVLVNVLEDLAKTVVLQRFARMPKVDRGELAKAIPVAQLYEISLYLPAGGSRENHYRQKTIVNAYPISLIRFSSMTGQTSLVKTCRPAKSLSNAVYDVRDHRLFPGTPAK